MNKRQTIIAFYKVLKIISIICAVVSVAALIAVTLYILINGVSKLNSELLFGDYSNFPSILPALVGTIEIILIASAISIPLGVGSAIFLVEYMQNKGKLVKIIRVATETLAGIPSIVYGLFGYLIFVVTLKMGYTILGGGMTIAIMILPVIVRQTEESLIAVPMSLREGAYALGASKVATIFKVVLPSASSGIVTAIILAIGRVISESAVLILTIGMVVNKIPESALSPGTSLALDIYYFSSHGYPDAAAATAVVLLILVIAINLVATGAGSLIRKSMGEVK